jgi:hypothetical protein
MTSQTRHGFAAFGLALGAAALLYACGSDDDTAAGGTGATSTTSHGGSGAQGGAAGHGAQGGSVGGSGGTGGSGGAGGSGAAAGAGGAPLSSTETCLQVCEAMEFCINGAGGAGGAGGGWIQTCLEPCYPSLETCTSEQLGEVLACVTPNITPNCNFGAYNVCANAVGCVDNG